MLASPDRYKALSSGSSSPAQRRSLVRMLNGFKGVLKCVQLVWRQAVVLKAGGAHWDRLGLARSVLAEKHIGEGHTGGRDVVEANVVVAYFADLNGDAMELLLAGRLGHRRKAAALALVVTFGACANTSRDGPAAEAGTDAGCLAGSHADGCQNGWSWASLKETAEGKSGSTDSSEGLHLECGDRVLVLV